MGLRELRFENKPTCKSPGSGIAPGWTSCSCMVAREVAATARAMQVVSQLALSATAWWKS